MNAAQIDFQQIRIKHILFKSKVRSVLYGGVLDRMFFSEAGPISQWFLLVGVPRYGNEHELQSMYKIHKQLLVYAHELFSLYKNGKIDDAHNGMQDLEKLSEKFLDLLAQLEKRLAATNMV
jgi:hypothetical protein